MNNRNEQSTYKDQQTLFETFTRVNDMTVTKRDDFDGDDKVDVRYAIVLPNKQLTIVRRANEVALPDIAPVKKTMKAPNAISLSSRLLHCLSFFLLFFFLSMASYSGL